MTWRCTCDALNAAAAQFCEACMKQRPGGSVGRDPGERTGSGVLWAPPVPKLTARDLALPQRLPESVVEPYLQQLRAIAAKSPATPSGRAVDPELERRYLENLAKKRATQEANP